MFFVAIAAALALAVGSASADPDIQAKRAQAQAIMGQLDQLDADLEQSIEAYNYANVELDRIDGELQVNAKHLVAAKKSLRVSQRRIATRLRELYIKGQGDSTLEVLLGSSSLDDIIARLEAIQRISSLDAKILGEVRRYKAEVQSHRRTLTEQRHQQAEIVADRAAQKATIESQLAERQQLYNSVKTEIVQMEAAERQRQAEFAAQARARQQAMELAAQQAATQSAAPLSSTSTAAPVEFEAPPPDGSKASQVVEIALGYLGTPYVWGGMSPSGFDCSGLVAYVYAQIGISLPHHASSMWNYGVPVSPGNEQLGDLVFFSGLGHMGMYIGGGQFIHAPHTGDVVRISYLSERGGNYMGARRIL